MLKNGSLEAIGTPEEIYRGIATPFQAGFFSEFSILPKNVLFDSDSSEAIIVLPHQLKPSPVETKLKIKVIKSYFKGANYLIFGIWGIVEVYFLHPVSLKGDETIYLSYHENN